MNTTPVPRVTPEPPATYLTTTVTVLIGNSDDKLTQQLWARFVFIVNQIIDQTVKEIHFSGGSRNESPWQNYCWVFEVDPEFKDGLKEELSNVAKSQFKQESIAWIEGSSDLV